jgi:hypothetical protein
MAFVNLPANLQDLFYSITDRVAKLETGPNSAQTTADSAQTTANSAQADATTAISNANAALAEANIAYALAGTSLQKDANTITNSSNNMTAINTNGITVYSGASMSSGARVIMNSAGIAGYNSSGTATFSILASTGAASFSGNITGSAITGSTLNISGNCIINSSGFLTATGATITGTITATSGSFTGSIYASSGTIGGFTIGSTFIYSGSSLTINSDGTITGGNSSTLYYGYANIGGGTAGSERLTVAGASVMNGTILSTSSITTQTSFYTPYHVTTGSAANAYINSSSGLIARSTASSQRYKHDIVNLVDVPELDPDKLLDLPVRAFRFNDGYLTTGDDREGMLVPGFIAEEVDAIYPAGADYVEGLGVETWNDRMIVPAMLAIIQKQDKRITALEAK